MLQPATTTEPGSPAFLLALEDVTRFARRVVEARPLTPLQIDCLRIVTEWIDTRGVAPTHAELCVELGLRSKSTVQRVLATLTEKGWIARDLARARAIVVLRRPPMPDFTEPEFVLSPDLGPC